MILLVGALLLLPSLTNAVSSTLTKKCYAPDGVSTPDSGDMIPCIPTDGVDSMCCAMNRSTPADVCQQNGLCLNEGNWFRVFCTDPTWKSPNCLPQNICTDSNSGGNPSDAAALTLCPDGSWCCGAQNITNCCNKNLGFKLPQKLTIFDSTPNTTANGTSFVTVTASPTASSNTGKHGVSVGVPVAVGIALAVLAIGGTTAGFLLGQKRGLRKGGNQAVGLEVADEARTWDNKGTPSASKYQSVSNVDVTQGVPGDFHELGPNTRTNLAELGAENGKR